MVVLETGLGGRCDATNAVPRTLVAAITKIGLDHTEILGDTVAKIAAEKAGILKPGCTLVCYPDQPKDALEVITAAANAGGHAVYRANGFRDEDWACLSRKL